jgi:hypothetical protein
VLPVRALNGVRYTVPHEIRPAYIDDYVSVRFRSDNIYRDKTLAVYFDDACVHKIKKRILAPGEMETLILPAALFSQYPDTNEITIRLEDGA